MRLVLPLLALALVALPCRSEDAVDRAIRDLASEDAEVRDAAEKAISDAGATGLKQVLAALEQSSDAEVRARLERVLPWLRIDASTDRFLRACGSQWFALREKGEIAGVEHHTAELTGTGCERRWTFVDEAWLKGDEGKILYVRQRLVCRHDLPLTPLEAEIDFRVPLGPHWLWTFGDKGIQLKRVRRGPHEDPEAPETEPVELKGNSTRGLIHILSLERLLERATCAGIERIDAALLMLSGNRGESGDVSFIAGDEETVKIDGRSFRGRRWSVRIPSGRLLPSDLLISPDSGYLSWSGDLKGGESDMNVEISSEAACRATGMVRDVQPEER